MIPLLIQSKILFTELMVLTDQRLSSNLYINASIMMNITKNRMSQQIYLVQKYVQDYRETQTIFLRVFFLQIPTHRNSWLHTDMDITPISFFYIIVDHVTFLNQLISCLTSPYVMYKVQLIFFNSQFNRAII